MRKRSFKDRKLDREWRKLLEVIGEIGMQIFNGAVKRDIMGEFTCTGKRRSTGIDYVVGRLEEKERVDEMKIGDNCDSDHHPVKVYVRGRRGVRVRRIRGKRKEESYGIVIGLEKGLRNIRRRPRGSK